MKFFITFRIRLLIILALLLLATLSVQFYLNLRVQEENDHLREQQEQAFLSGISLGFKSMTSEHRLQYIVKQEGQAFYDEKATERIRDVIVIDNEWQVSDTLSGKYLPTSNKDGETIYSDLRKLTDLPPLMETRNRLGDDIENFPNASANQVVRADSEAHTIPIETSKGRWYVMVILKNDQKESARIAAQPLIYTLGILLFSTIITIFLVWRFTQPIANLSKAAKRVADGDLDFRLKDADRADEMGRLAMQFNDMTEELSKSRELQSQLQEAEKSAVVGRLASAIAHEIRNPLNYINLTLDHLRKKFKPEDSDKQETFEKLTSQLKTEVDRINQQVSDFLRYSRPTRLDLKPIEIRQVIKDSLRIVEPQSEEQGITISLIERESVPTAFGDEEVLRSVFNNLFINAAQAMEKTGGKLSVILSSESDFVKVEVKDTGQGIPDKNFDKIFQPYFSTKETGTGLGLAIVKKIVEDHNGTIEVESVGNNGTTFTVKLPLSK